MSPIDRADFDALKTRVRGPLILPGESAYDDARSVWNAMIDKRPAAIIRCLGVADVVAGVNFAREHSIPLSVKGGGHNIAGLAVCDDGLMLDMSLMRGVFVDRENRTARAQAGCLLGDVDRETQLHGLATVFGFVSNTGIAGLTLGGGIGYLTRQYGWTCDNVVSMEVVTADGNVVTASETENQDLLWALRGGGGNFGVVTSFEYKLYPVGPEIVAGAIAWRAEDAPEVLEMYRRTVEETPPEFVCVAAIRPAPPAPWLPKEIHGKSVVVLFVCHTGSLEEGEKLAAPIKAFGSPVGDVVIRRSYVAQQSLVDATQPKGRRYYLKSEFFPGCEGEMLGHFIESGARIRSPHSLIVIFPMDGAVARLPDDHSAVGNRDAGMLLNISASWENPEDDDANIEWARSSWRALRRFSTGGTYINFLGEDEGGDRTRAAYGENYDRLAEVKAKWDSANLFRQNKNIVPKTEAIVGDAADVFYGG
jgi:FAD/FMN-containing dehydrogenase